MFNNTPKLYFLDQQAEAVSPVGPSHIHIRPWSEAEDQENVKVRDNETVSRDYCYRQTP